MNNCNIIFLTFLVFGGIEYSLQFSLLHSLRSDCDFSYNETLPNGPAHWSEICADSYACNHGKRQSPIDIITSLPYGSQSRALNATYIEVENMVFVNRGTTLEVSNNNTRVGLSGGPLPSFYQLINAHFHAPSEHTFNGIRYPFEMHLVHSNQNGTKLAVLGFFFQYGDAPNDFLTQLEGHIKQIPYEGNTTIVDAHFEDLLEGVGSYFHYEGSLTTPPCSEIVDWLFSEIILESTPLQIQNFVTALHINNRPIQHSNSRPITEYKTKSENNNDTNNTKEKTLIIGVVAGSVFGCMAIGIIVFLFYKNNKKLFSRDYIGFKELRGEEDN